MQVDFPNIRHMRVFLETARTGSVSVAAQRCHLSQPAATQALSRLEAAIGTQLLIRKRRQAVLTVCGAAFAYRARRALENLRTAARAALREAGEKPGRGGTFDLKITAAQLRGLTAIADTGSFTIAARELGVSQPTVHRSARNLEALSGVPFFTAHHSGVRLTPAAETFATGAKLAQGEIRLGLEEISRELGEEKATFVLGSLPLARTSIVPKAIHKMVTRFPGIQIRVVEGRYSELLRSLRDGDLDCLIGALRHPDPVEDIRQERLFDDALAIVAHPRHPLAGRENLTLSDTLRYPWIAPPKTTPAGQYLFETLKIHRIPETPVRVVASSLAILRGVLSEGDYVSIVSRHQISVDEGLGAITVLNVELAGHIRDIGLTYRSHWKPTETQACFIEYLREFSRVSR
ncbi:MAG: LysR family transcriptional regulator [Rhodobacter sp.]|nr:LysR family transcriptional regulator [Rhodobacter sp.]